MNKLIATTALALVLGGPAVAQATQDQTTGQIEPQQTGQQAQMSGGQGFYQPDANDLFLSSLMDAQVYAPAGGQQDAQQQQGQQAAGSQDEDVEVEVTVEGPEGETETETITTGDASEQNGVVSTQPTSGQQAQGQVASGTTGETSESLQEQRAEIQEDQQELIGAGGTETSTSNTQMTGTTSGQGGGTGLEMQTISQNQIEGMENIGSVSDIIVDEQGAIRAVVLDVGGFLGMGAREVALSTNEIQFGRSQDDAQTFYVISQVASSELQNAPEFNRAELEEQRQGGTQQAASVQPADEQQQAGVADTAATGAAAGAGAGGVMMGAGDAGQNEMAAQPGAQQDAWRGQRNVLVAPEMQREGYMQAEAEEVTADTLLGANVYDVNDENIGSVQDVVMGQDGQARYAVIDVGGFLGFGTHTVAIGFDEMQVMHDEGWADLRVYVDVTQEQLENMPQYEQAAN